MNSVSAAHEETFGRKKPSSKSSYNRNLSSFNSARPIWYGVFDIGAILDKRFIKNFTSLFGGRSGKSLRKTSKSFEYPSH